LEDEVAKYVVQQIHLLSSQKDGVEVVYDIIKVHHPARETADKNVTT
jgi:hypothetical protein